MKAIITAAGYGSRMYPLGQNMPKCLLSVAGKPLLGRSLDVLNRCGISDITVVTGFCQEQIAMRYGERVSIRFNPHYEITGSVFSLWTVRDLLTGKEDVLIMNADIIFTLRPIQKLREDTGLFCLAVDQKQCDQEDRKVRVKGNRVVDIGKNLELDEAFGEFVYIAKVTKEGISDFRHALMETAKKDSQFNWPEVFRYLIEKGYPVNFVVVEDTWAEIDTPEDYRKAVELFDGKELR